MKRDWIWAWIAGVPAMVIAAISIKSAGKFTDSPWVAIGLASVFAMIVLTSILWLKNQSSIRKIRRSGGEIELIIRPGDALVRAPVLFLMIFGLNVLLRLLFTRPAIEWGDVILYSAVMSYCLSLATTAYKKPK